MPGRINDQDIQALRDGADIAVVIGDHTSLRRAGTRLKGLCPFHSEKTPSFTVDAERGMFHCFGCGVGGDVYAFLQRAESLTFPEAVERLARIVGYELRYEELSPGQRKALGRRTRLGEALGAAAEFYQARLRGPDGRPALAYLTSRDVEDDLVATFQLGWAPDEWAALARHLHGLGFATDEIVDAGLATRGRQGPVDRFRGRVVFPILDAAGRDVLGFGGRILPDVELRTAPRDSAPPKYINSPETEVYKKARTLYGLNWARVDVQRRQTVLVVEGYLDVLGLHRAGVRNVVATCGTALTADHFRVLEKHAPRVVLALDADDAGYAAADKARALAAEVGIREVAVLPLPPGRDPADLAAEGRDAVARALRNVVTAVEFQIGHLLRTADVSTPEGQADAYRRTFPLLLGIDDRFVRYRYVRDVVAPAVRLNADLIERELDAAATAGAASPLRTEEVRAAAPGALDPTDQRDPQAALESCVLQVALQRADLLPDTWNMLTDEDFRMPAARQVFTALSDSGRLEDVLDRLADDEIRSRVRALAVAELVVEADAVNVRRLVGNLLTTSVTRRRQELLDEFSRLNRGTDRERWRQLYGELERLERRRRALAEEAG